MTKVEQSLAETVSDASRLGARLQNLVENFADFQEFFEFGRFSKIALGTESRGAFAVFRRVR